MKRYLFTIPAILFITACASANAGHARPVKVVKAAGPGHWVLNPNKCPDLLEDRAERHAMRRDEAVYRGPRDAAEDRAQRRAQRRDEAVTNCPARAWEWHGPAYRAKIHPARPATAKVFYNPKRGTYYRRVGKNRIVIKF